jgi:homoserine O-acetyltransferase/O-succinyltransferase
MPDLKIFRPESPFVTESGFKISNLEIAYQCFGQAPEKAGKMVWVFHALTANSNPLDWWPGLFGKGKLFDPEEATVICANILGSCYGSSGPHSINPDTGKPFGPNFPLITIRDMVRAHFLLRDFLGVKKIHVAIGGSMGGYQALEWSVLEPDFIERMILLATSARESAWGIAIHTTQRMALEADPEFFNPEGKGGTRGLMIARGIGMLSYRNYQIFCEKQTDPDPEKKENFKVANYIRHQGEKLAGRFTAHAYHALTRSMDSHNLGRGRASMENVLSQIKAKTLLIGISSDILCPLDEQKFLASGIPGSHLQEIESDYGHDGFLVEAEKIKDCILAWEALTL